MTGGAAACEAADAGEPSAAVLKASPAGSSRRGFFGEKNTFPNLNIDYFHLGGRGMNAKGFGEATLRERSTRFSFTSVGDGANVPLSFTSQKIPFLPGIMKENLPAGSQSLPVDQPLEGNIAQIHRNIPKPPQPTPKHNSGERTILLHWVEIFPFGQVQQCLRM